jgi:hypothetical protein
MEIEYGAKVVDKDERLIGVVDYRMRDAYTGALKKFRVKTELAELDPFFSVEDVCEATAETVKLKIAIGTEEH